MEPFELFEPIKSPELFFPNATSLLGNIAEKNKPAKRFKPSNHRSNFFLILPYE